MSTTVSQAISMENLARPQSVALIGVSPDISRPATRALRGLMRAEKPPRLYPLSQKYTSVEGVPCYGTPADLPEVPDLTVVAVRSEAVLDAVSDMAAIGAKNFVVFSSGFSEAGEAGAEQQDALRRFAVDHGLSIVGPNSLGIINFLDEIYCSFSSILQADGVLLTGRVALVTQSGAIGAYVYAMARERGIGFSHMVSTGNEVQTEAADIASFLLDDDRVDAIAFYVEGVRDGSRLIACCRKARELGKAIIILRAGDSDAGRSAARSHTGALAGSARVADAVFRRYGVIGVDTPEDLLSACQAVVSGKRFGGSRIGVLTGSGGGGVLVADACARWDLSVPPIGETTVRRLTELLPPWAAIGNPTDVTATVLMDPESTMGASISALSDDDNVDSVVVFMGSGGDNAVRLAESIAEAVRRSDKYCAVIWLGMPDAVAETLHRGAVPTFAGVEECVRPLGRLARARQPRIEDPVPGSGDDGYAGDVVRALKKYSSEVLDEDEAKQVLSVAGLDQLPRRVVIPAARIGAEWPEAVAGLSYPLVAKTLSRVVLHKSAIGGVVIGIEDEPALRAAVDTTFRAGVDHAGPESVAGVLVEEMAPDGVQVIIGMTTDETYGPVLLLGIGGVLTELVDDVAVILPPASAADVRAALAETRLRDLLAARREPASSGSDIDALCDLVSRVSRFVEAASPLLRELDLNPVIVHPRGRGVSVVDAVMVLSADGAVADGPAAPTKPNEETR